MKMHVSLYVKNIERTVEFYESFFSIKASKVRGDYAKFELEAGTVEKSGFTAPVFMASVLKNVILYDQPQDLLDKENAQVSIEEVNGDRISVGSMDEVSTSGNWPSIYDRKQ